jgi:hypothetical protein
MSTWRIVMMNNAGAGVRVLETAIRNAGDWTAFWQDRNGGVSEDWRESRIDMFLSQGASTGRRWADYNRMEKRYYVPVKSWVLGGVKMTKGSVLRYTTTPQSRSPGSGGKAKERLFPAMTVASNANYVYTVDRSKNTVELGTNLPYAWNHDQGIGGWTRTWGRANKKTVTVLTPRRPLTLFGDTFISDLRHRLGVAASNMQGKVGITDATYAANFKLNGGRIGLP